MAAIDGLKPDFGYVLGTAAASWAVHHVYMASKVVSARKKYNIQYPDLYADASNCSDEQARAAFNCVQRAHQNSLENQPIFLALLTLSGLQYPITAASFGAAFLVGRIGYVEGYCTGEPKKRMNWVTSLYMVGMLGLVGTTVKFAVDLLSK